MSLGQRIRAARKAANLTQDDVARRFDISRNAVSLWESDTTTPDADKMTALADLFHMGVDALWSGRKPKVSNIEHKAIDDMSRSRNVSVVVPELDVRAGQGGGAFMDGSENEIAKWELPENLLRGQTTAPLNALRIIQALGNSNEPEIPPGARLVIDTSDKRPSPPGYFCIFDGLGLVIKRVELVLNSDPPTLRLSSANPSYAVYERTIDEVDIKGRVMGRWAWM